METVTHLNPGQGSVPAPRPARDMREAALIFLGIGSTAEGIREYAASRAVVAEIAGKNGDVFATTATLMDLADSMDALTAKGLTADECAVLAGLKDPK